MRSIELDALERVEQRGLGLLWSTRPLQPSARGDLVGRLRLQRHSEATIPENVIMFSPEG